MTSNGAISDMTHNRWEKDVPGQIRFWRDFLQEDPEDAQELAEFNAWVKAEGLEDGVVTEKVSEPTDFDGNPVVPDHYAFPGGVRVHQISGYLTSFAGQALQYIARSSRLDGANKGDTVADLKKAHRFLELEIARLEDWND